VGGTGTALASAAPPPPKPTMEVLPFGEGMNRPVLASGPQPEYPQKAREAKVEGTMLVRCVITTAGTLRNCRVLKSLPFLDEPVLSALAQQRYTPVTFQGRPVDVEYVIPFKFKMQ
jgi:protein TonB